MFVSDFGNRDQFSWCPRRIIRHQTNRQAVSNCICICPTVFVSQFWFSLVAVFVLVNLMGCLVLRGSQTNNYYNYHTDLLFLGSDAGNWCLCRINSKANKKKQQFSLCNPTPPQPRLGWQSSHFEALATTVCRLCYKTRTLCKINISLFWNIIKNQNQSQSHRWIWRVGWEGTVRNHCHSDLKGKGKLKGGEKDGGNYDEDDDDNDDVDDDEGKEGKVEGQLGIPVALPCCPQSTRSHYLDQRNAGKFKPGYFSKDVVAFL